MRIGAAVGAVVAISAAAVWFSLPSETVYTASAATPQGGPAAAPLGGPLAVAPDRANVWIDTNGGRCVRKDTPGAYANGEACATLKQAYAAAQRGDTINVVDGMYGSDVMGPFDKPVTVRAAGPGKPSFGISNFAGAGVTIRGLKFEFRGGTTPDDDWACLGPPPAGRGLSGQIYMNGIINPCANDITFDGVEIDGLRNPGTPGACAREGIKLGAGADDFTFRNGSVHGIYDRKGADLAGKGIRIENTTFYDIRVRNACDPDVHNECIYIPQAERAVFRNNKFLECPTMALFFSGEPDTDSDHVTLEGNLFTHTIQVSDDWHAAPCALKIGLGPSRINGWIVRYNTFETTPCNDNLPAGETPGQWYGNLGGASCISGFVYHHNVGETCGGASSVTVARPVNDKARRNQAPFYENAPAGVFDLRPGSAAIDRGDPARYPASDTTGGKRPAGARPDAGAYEYVPAARGASRRLTLSLTGSGTGNWSGKGTAESSTQSLRYGWTGTLAFRVPAAGGTSFRARTRATLTATWDGALEGTANAGAYRCAYKGARVAAPVVALLSSTRTGALELRLSPATGQTRFFTPAGAGATAACATDVGRTGPPHFSPAAFFRDAAAANGFLTTSAAVIRLPGALLRKQPATVAFPSEAGRTSSPGLGALSWTNRGTLAVRAR